GADDARGRRQVRAAHSRRALTPGSDAAPSQLRVNSESAASQLEVSCESTPTQLRVNSDPTPTRWRTTPSDPSAGERARPSSGQIAPPARRKPAISRMFPADPCGTFLVPHRLLHLQQRA